MSKLLKLLKMLSKKGFATVSEKAEVKDLVKELEAGDAEALADEISSVEALPTEDPNKADEAEEIVEEITEKVVSKMKSTFDAKMSEMEESLKAWKKKHDDLMEKGAGIHADGVQAKRKKLNTYIRGLMKSIVSNDTAKIKELTTDGAGEDIVDTELSAEIRHLMTEYGVARREFFTTVLSKHTYDANALATDVSVGWVSQGAVIPTVSVTTNQTGLTLKKLAAIALMSRELLEDQEIDLFSFIAGRVAEGFAKKEDEAFFNGEGSGDTANAEYTGLLYNANIADVEVTDKGGSADGTSFADIGAEDIYAMIDELPQGAHAGAKFYFNRTILSKIRLIKDGDGRYIYQNPLDATGVPTLAGYPVVLVEAMPSIADDAVDTPFALFGDLKKASILGYTGGIAVDRFNAGVVRNQANNADVNLITTDQEAVRWVSRVGAITILPSAVVRLKTKDNS